MTAIAGGWEFDHVDPWLAPRINEVLAELRGDCPVVHSTKYGGFWAALTHEAVKEVTSDPQTYTSTDCVTIPRVHSILQPPLDFDPPEHTAYRRIVQRQFTRQGAARYEPLLRRLVRERLGELIEQGSADLIATLARNVPPMAIAMILGLPPEDGERFMYWVERQLMTAATGDLAENERVTQEFTEYIADHLGGAREENAVIGAIDEGRFNGRPLTQEEQVGMIALLIAAGHETTVHGIGAMIYYLATVDGLKERLIADPALIPPMIDESLRMEAPIVSLARTVRGGAELAGQKLEDGERVLMVFSAANHDPAVFDRPEEFVCPRERNPHVTFGSGVHRCLGEHLALLEMRIITEELLAMAPGFRLAEGYEPDWVIGPVIRGLTTLPVVFSPAQA
ncbi:cytochrome P450 [Actinoallomurus bryophytorum]|uniref:Cytochrome P450 n=1 Tax=Actinoallomurus bryophytorum TaxID=1490222 RepID=A0A543BZJ4_9ACTN|nr:cytochrome P450 [Actinoallomurus bryophytorum]TQL90252.1 cytochrome P450 [Actinoallomurus bryophytorum]